MRQFSNIVCISQFPESKRKCEKSSHYDRKSWLFHFKNSE